MTKVFSFVRGFTRLFLLALGVMVTLVACSSGQDVGSTSPSGVISANPSARGGGTQERVGGIDPGGTARTDTDILSAFVGFTRDSQARGGSRINIAPGDIDVAEAIDDTGSATTAGALVIQGGSQGLRQREYINQEALRQVGSAYAYARSTGRVETRSEGLAGFAVVPGRPNLGKDSHINIVTSLEADGFVPEDSVDLAYPEFSQTQALVRLLVTVGSDTRTVEVLCADADACTVMEVNAATDLTVTANTEYKALGRVYGAGSNLRFVDEDVVGTGTDADNGAGEGVIALINGLRDNNESRTMVGTHGIAPEATLSIRAADSGIVGDVVKVVQDSQSAGNAQRGNVIIIDRDLALDYSTVPLVEGAVGQVFSFDDGDFDNTDADKLSAYVTRLERGRFTVPTDSSLDAFSAFTVSVDSLEFVNGETEDFDAGVHTADTEGLYRLPAGTVVDGRTLTDAEDVLLEVGDTFTLPAGGGEVTLPSALLDAQGNPVYGQEAQNRELVRQLVGGYYGATGNNDILGAMLDNMLAHNARNQDIYILEAGITGALNEQSSFSGLPIIMEALAQDRRRAVQGIIDRAVAASDGLAYDATAQTLTFSDGRQSFVITGVTTDPIGAVTVTSAELVGSDSAYSQVMVRLTLTPDDGATTTRNVVVDAANARSMQSVLPYSLLVTDADYDASAASSQCGAIAQDYCIAAPHTYTYHNTNTDAADDSGDSSHAPAALVAGGVALMQQIFEGQLTSAEIVDRLLRTASQNFDLDGDGANDYVNEKASKDVTVGDLATAAERFGQGLLDLECAVRPVFATGDDVRCRQHALAQAQADCLARGWGWNSDINQCVTATSVGAADSCMDDNLEFRDGACRATVALCTTLGQVYDGSRNNQRCVATGAGCPTGQGVRMVDRMVNSATVVDRVCYDLAGEIDNDDRTKTVNEGAQGCHLAGRVYLQVEAGGEIARSSCIATGADCPERKGVDTSDVIVNTLTVPGRRCVVTTGEGDSLQPAVATETTCMDAGLGFDGTDCVTRAVCSAGQSYVAADNTCADAEPMAQSDCSNQGKILNLGAADVDNDNRCVDSVAQCDVGETLGNTTGTMQSCVDADGICTGSMGYDAITKECVMTPTRVTQCTSLGRILGTSASTTANVDGCVANAAACATDFAAQDGACIAKIECVRLGRGYDGTDKECATATQASCLAASDDSVLNMAGDACLTSRFNCDAGQAAIGDTTDGFACAAKVDCLDDNRGYNSAERQCIVATTVQHCRDAADGALFDPDTTNNCVANASACDGTRVQGMTMMDEHACITVDECRTGMITTAGIGNVNTPGAVLPGNKECQMANAVNCAAFGGRDFDVSAGCSMNMAVVGECTDSSVTFVSGVGCTTACPTDTQGYDTSVGDCVDPTEAIHCQARVRVYKPTDVTNPDGGGTCVGTSVDGCECLR